MLMASCVDRYEPVFNATVDVIVVDGTITNLAEPQIIRLNRSKADPFTGRFGTLPMTKATVEVVVDSAQVIAAHETTDGTYQLPGDFRGQIGHTYQLRFTLSDGQRYESAPETIPALVPISRVYHSFSPTALPTQRPDGQASRVRAASEVFVDWQDPADQRNYYRWGWKLWEKQEWCRTCQDGFYLLWNPFNENQVYEDCYAPYTMVANGGEAIPAFVNDYRCRTQCWEILYDSDLNLFDDRFSNGGQLTGRRIAQIPYYQSTGCLVEVRQSLLTPAAHTYFSRLAEQSQNTGGLADSPPAAPIGNVRNLTNDREAIVGHFSATSVSSVRYWIDRKDATGKPPGLFQALNGLEPSPESQFPDPNTGRFKANLGGGGKNSDRSVTAICFPADNRTPFKPEGWRD
ncbi:hypothetical protein GCM10027190_15860 [Spirosoma areae]